MSDRAARDARRRALLELQREHPGVRGVELHLFAMGELRTASGAGIGARLLSRFSGLVVVPSNARLQPEEVAAWLEHLQSLDRSRLPLAARTALDRLAA